VTENTYKCASVGASCQYVTLYNASCQYMTLYNLQTRNK